MKKFFWFGILLMFVAIAIWNLKSNETVADAQKREMNQPAAPTDKKMPVLVELFTSEGCSSCPPADKNLAFFEREQPFAQAEVIALELHVDYWNSLGWKDEFSSPMFSRRQEIYSQALKLDSNYTPQMIVDGQTEFVGSNLGQAQKAILDAAKIPKANVEIAPTADKYKIKISDVPAHENATVFVAITEDNLASDVKRGENSGKRLEHAAVVRDLSSLGTIAAGQNNFEIETAAQIQSAWNKKNLKLVVFVQENVSRKILGVNGKDLN